MASMKFNFASKAGKQLSGVLETGSGAARAYAVFAHCFTCDKTSLAATRISRALADKGLGVLRFDFTGLGESEGEFGGGLTGDVQDIAAAVAAMTSAGMTPQLLIGHSFGGAAVLAAAGALECVKAVAVIGAPFDAKHVLGHIGAAFEGVAAGETVAVSIGGRPFLLSTDFVEDIRAHDQQARIAGLGRALLVLHSPLDEIVSIDNAAGIFQAARHPKSFVSLDDADHLLRRSADAGYAAGVIAAWSSRYLDAAPEAATLPAPGVRVEETGAGKFQVRALTPMGSLLIDEPKSVGGLGSGPTPYDLVAAALGACTAMTCRLYAARKEWPLVRVAVDVGHTGKTASEPDQFVREIAFEGDLDADQQSRLLAIAERCPVHQTLTRGATVMTKSLESDISRDEPSEDPECHMKKMAEACAQSDDASHALIRDGTVLNLLN